MIYIKRFCRMQEVTTAVSTWDKCTEKCREVGGANSSSLKVLLEWTGNVRVCAICENTFLVHVAGPWKVLKNGCNFLYKPLCYQWPVSILCFPMFLSLGVLQKHKWEDAMTVDKKSWGYRRNTVLSDFLTMDDLTSILASAVRWDKIPCLPAFPLPAFMVW